MAGLNGILGADFQCSTCGRRHTAAVRGLLYGEGALGQVAELCARYDLGRRISLVADERTFRAAGQTVLSELERSSLETSVTLVPDPGPNKSPVCDDQTKDQIEGELGSCELLLAVGGGVINDLVKWIAHGRGLPYIAVATAASMNGYSSANVAATVRGVKTLLPATGPVAVLSAPDVLAQAPFELTAAGFGDVLAKFTSTTDWRLGQILFGEYYCALCVDLQKRFDPATMTKGGALLNRAPHALRELFEALTLSGILMTMAGSSSPASGGEHMISHTLDMMASLDGGAHDLHGRQVGVATILTAALYAEVLQVDRPDFVEPPSEIESGFWGGLTGAVEDQNARKRAKAAQAVARFRAQSDIWDEIRRTLGPMLQGPETVKEGLRAAGAAHCLADIATSRERFLQAVAHAHEIRDRYTVIDLARASGVLPGRAEALVDRWLMQ